MCSVAGWKGKNGLLLGKLDETAVLLNARAKRSHDRLQWHFLIDGWKNEESRCLLLTNDKGISDSGESVTDIFNRGG